MAAAGDGAVAHDATAEIDTAGAFKRTAADHRNWVSREEGNPFQPASGRYHIYASFACPWACRCLAIRSMKGLEDAIGVSIVHPTWQETRPEDPADTHRGWVFRSPEDPPLVHPSGAVIQSPADGLIPDDVNGVACIRDLYDLSRTKDGIVATKYTVPVLWDKQEQCIVNNESSEIIIMLNNEFNEFARNPELDLYPERLREAIDREGEWIYETINDGVYRCGFAKSQAAYETAITNLFGGMDRLEALLEQQRYIGGDAFTLADVRAFMTLVRYDAVYVCYFKTLFKRVVDYPNIRNFCRDVFQQPGVEDAVNMEHIVRHYFTSHPVLNAYGIVPKVPDVLGDFRQPHDRDRF